MIKICFITTINHNIGDDFIREGIEYLLLKLGLDVDYQYIHKHTPITARLGFEKWRNNSFAKLLDNILPLWLSKDKIIESDFVIQSGAPVYWCHPGIKYAHCSENEWYNPLIKRRLQRSKARFINIAAGSCQIWESNGEELLNCLKCSAYINELYSKSVLTTLRDSTAKKMLNSLDLDAPVLPCTSIFVSEALQILAQEHDFIALNFMKGGGHYNFGQKIDETKWEKEFARFYKDISKTENCIIVCHNKTELNYTKSIIPEAKTFISDNYRDYIKLYSKARFGIMNRIHGAFPIISFGRPAVIIGTDTRVKMAEVVGSQSYFVNQMDYNKLMEVFEFLSKGANNFSERFFEIKKKTEQEYVSIFNHLIKK